MRLPAPWVVRVVSRGSRFSSPDPGNGGSNHGFPLSRIPDVSPIARHQKVGRTRERNGEKVYDIFSESVLINQDLPADLFANPSGPATKPQMKQPAKKK